LRYDDVTAAAMEDKKFEYRGDLGTTPLPEILATIHRYRVPGIVTLSRGPRRRRIHIDGGLVIFATSNEPEMGLGAHLLRRGALTIELAREAEERRVKEDLRLGQILLQMGIVTAEGLNTAIHEQILSILWTAFDWDGGDVVFEIGRRRAGEVVRIDISIPGVILGGVRRAADVRRLIQRLGNSQTVLERTENSMLEIFRPEERAFYQKIDGHTGLQALCVAGPGSISENARCLYAMYCLGLLRAGAAAIGARKIQYRTEGGALGS
jgi:hypothetical protein